MPQLKTCLGVDLGHHTVKIVELALDKDGARVVRAASAPTGVAPTMNAEEQQQAIASACRELVKKARFSTKKAIFSISGLKVFVRRFRLPKTNEERLERMIQFEARQQIPFPVEQTTLQFQSRDIPGETDVEVFLSAVRTEEVRKYMALVGKTGLTPVMVGVSSFALYNAHRLASLTIAEAQEVIAPLMPRKAAKPKKEKKTKKAKKGKNDAADEIEAAMADQQQQSLEGEEAFGDEFGGGDEFAFDEVKGLVNIGANSYDIAIGRMGKTNATLLFIRTVAMGGDNMTKAIQKALDVESFFDAERIKTSSTQLMAFNFDFEEEGQINQEASMAVTEVADRMVTEIRRSLDFFITQPDGMAIDALVLSGGQAQIPQLDSYLEEKLTLPVSVAQEISPDSPIKWQQSAGSPTPYMVALGLALQGIGLADLNVDFLPEERKIVRDFPYKVTAVMVVLLIGIIFLASTSGSKYADVYRREAEGLRGGIERDRAQVEYYQQSQALHDEVSTNFSKLGKAFGQRDFWIDVMARLAAVKPPGVLVENIEMEHDGRVVITGLSEVQVIAAYFREAIQEEFADELEENPVIDRVMALGRAVEGFAQDPTRFTISFEFATKINHLDITPTPTPTPAGGGGPNMMFPGAGGFGNRANF